MCHTTKKLPWRQLRLAEERHRSLSAQGEKRLLADLVHCALVCTKPVTYVCQVPWSCCSSVTLRSQHNIVYWLFDKRTAYASLYPTVLSKTHISLTWKCGSPNILPQGKFLHFDCLFQEGSSLSSLGAHPSPKPKSVTEALAGDSAGSV